MPARMQTSRSPSMAFAGRAMSGTLAQSPSGARALCGLAEELGTGRVDIRTVLLNPDQAGLDLDRTSEVVRGALVGSCSRDSDLRSAVVDTLAGVRLDGDIIEAIVSAIRAGAPTSPDDAKAVASIDEARRALRQRYFAAEVGIPAAKG